MRCLALPLILLALLLGAAVAQAARQPTTSERSAISKAIVADVRGNFPAGTRLPVTGVRVSSVDGHYAAAYVGPPTKAGRALTDRAFVALHKGRRGWKVVDLGTDQVGCRLLPKPVERDLFHLNWCTGC